MKAALHIAEGRRRTILPSPNLDRAIGDSLVLEATVGLFCGTNAGVKEFQYVYFFCLPASSGGIHAGGSPCRRVRADPAGGHAAGCGPAAGDGRGVGRFSDGLAPGWIAAVFYFEKGASYYFSSYAFLAKLSVFLIVAALSAAPTIEFLSWRKAITAGQAPSPAPAKLNLIRKIIHFELIGVVVILLCAAIMARGGWH